jgi:gluconate 2-dehydrogenase gamma chain
MGGQYITRREAIRLIGLASVAGAFPGFCKWTFACNHPDPAAYADEPRATIYRPLFFNNEEYATVECLTELIIPDDESPGAQQAGVIEFIDFMVANGADLQTNRGAWRPPDPVSQGYGVQSRFRYGIGWIDAHAQRLYGKPFRHCASAEQRDLLDHLAYKDRYRLGEDDGRAFFQMVREYTVAGFYTSRIGLEQLNYPGLKTMWMQMPGCPHKDDPEHRHVSTRTA